VAHHGCQAELVAAAAFPPTRASLRAEVSRSPTRTRRLARALLPSPKGSGLEPWGDFNKARASLRARGLWLPARVGAGYHRRGESAGGMWPCVNCRCFGKSSGFVDGCGCEFCKAPCDTCPARSTVGPRAPLSAGKGRLCLGRGAPAGAAGQAVPDLVPARRDDGACHWYFDGKCAVHENAPTVALSLTPTCRKRRWTGVSGHGRSHPARRRRDGLYYRVWLHLCEKG